MSQPEPTVQEQFELLYERLQFFHDSSLDSVFKVAGFLLLVTGWVLTSDNAQELIARDPVVRAAAVATVLLAAVVFAGVALRVVRESNRAFRRLKTLGYMPPEHYEDLVIRPVTIVPFLVADVILTTVLCVIILRL